MMMISRHANVITWSSKDHRGSFRSLLERYFTRSECSDITTSALATYWPAPRSDLAGAPRPWSACISAEPVHASHCTSSSRVERPSSGCRTSCSDSSPRVLATYNSHVAMMIQIITQKEPSVLPPDRLNRSDYKAVLCGWMRTFYTTERCS